MTVMTFDTREAWLTAGADALRPLFAENGYPVDVPVRVTLGFPSRGALSLKRKVVGECWAPEASGDGTAEISVTPLLDDPIELLAILAHEMCHAAVGNKAKHGRKFAKAATAMMLEGKPTATVPGDTFRAWAAPVLESLGPIPHSKLTPMARTALKPDVGRMLKVECPCCGYIARVTKKWLEASGAPVCPTSGKTFVCEGASVGEDE
jgi:hypothetical protein